MSAILSIVILLFCNRAFARVPHITIEELDVSADNAARRDKFFTDRDANMHHYQQLLKYFDLTPIEFPEVSFNAYVKQLIDLSKVPGFVDQLLSSEERGKKFKVSRALFGKAEVSFQPIRPIHGIFRGLIVEGKPECIAGDDVDNLTAQRFAAVVGTGAKMYLILADLELRGWLFVNPRRSKKTQEIFPNLEFGSQIFKEELKGKNSKETFFDYSLPIIVRNLPQNWRKPFVADTNIINNAGALTTVRDSLAFRLGVSIGTKEDFESLDSPVFIKSLIEASPRNSLKGDDLIAKYHSSEMITDATSDASTTYFQFVAPDPQVLWNEKKFIDFYTYSSQRLNHLAHLMQIEALSDVNKEHLNVWWNDLSSKEKAALMGIFQQHAGWGVLIPSEMIRKNVLTSEKEILDFFKSIPKNDEKFSKKNRSFLKFFKNYSVKPLSDQQLFELTDFLEFHDDMTILANLNLENFEYPEEYLNLIRQLRRVEAYKDQAYFEYFISESYKHFLQLEPSQNQISSLLDQIRPLGVLVKMLPDVVTYLDKSGQKSPAITEFLEPYFLASEFTFDHYVTHGCRTTISGN